MFIVPVILCGGKGSRLWPLSRSGYPKQFLNLCGDNSLLQQTASRLCGLANVADPIVISNHEHRFLVSEQLRANDAVKATIVLEPEGRNTAPAVAAAALIGLEQNKDTTLVVLPSDHIILDQEVFQQLIMQAVSITAQGHLVTLGITPTQAHTGYGYIKRGEPLANHCNAYKVSAFTEKPDSSTAEEFINSGTYYWNSGMFIFQAEIYLQELEKLQPYLLNHVKQAVMNSERDLDFIRLEKHAFTACSSNSIDYAIMEHTDRAAVITAENLHWSDIGSWDSLANISPKDELENNVIGDVMIENVTNCYLHSETRMIAAVGIENIVVVETADAVLVATKDKVQEVKKIVDKLNLYGRSESTAHLKVYRPWGSFERIDLGARFQVKRIIVNPGASLSSQMHYHRAEHWIVVKGTARVINGDKETLLSENQSTYIPIGTIHRLENPGKFPLELIEVQSGGYLGEDDIVRFEDVYGRTSCETS